MPWKGENNERCRIYIEDRSFRVYLLRDFTKGMERTEKSDKGKTLDKIVSVIAEGGGHEKIFSLALVAVLLTTIYCLQVPSHETVAKHSQ